MRAIRYAVLFSFALLLLTSCESMRKTFSSSPDESSAPAGASVSAETTSYYYDFEDVLVPQDMEKDKDESYVFSTNNIKAGVLVFDGRVESTSLTEFFKDNMAKDGWNLVSSVVGKRTLLFFDKPSKFCIISIMDNRFSTHLEVWLGSKLQSSGAVTPAHKPAAAAPPQAPEERPVMTEPPLKQQGLSN